MRSVTSSAELVEVELEALAGQRRVLDDAARVSGPELVGRIAGVGEQDLVAVVDQRQQHLGQRVLGAHRDEHLVTLGRATPRGHLGGDRVAQLVEPGSRHVADLAVDHRAVAGLDDVLGGLELVALVVALLEVDDRRAAVRLQRFGLAHRGPLRWQLEVSGAPTCLLNRDQSVRLSQVPSPRASETSAPARVAI